jgi:hypothetical protein
MEIRRTEVWNHTLMLLPPLIPCLRPFSHLGEGSGFAIRKTLGRLVKVGRASPMRRFDVPGLLQAWREMRGWSKRQ